MKLEEFRKKGQENTAKASDIARSLALAGIGIIWVIKDGNKDVLLTDNILFIPLAIVSIALIVDLLQYFIAGLVWLNFYRVKEAEGKNNDDDVKSKKWRSGLIYKIFYLKFALIILAYFFIIKALFKYF